MQPDQHMQDLMQRADSKTKAFYADFLRDCEEHKRLDKRMARQMTIIEAVIAILLLGVLSGVIIFIMNMPV